VAPAVASFDNLVRNAELLIQTDGVHQMALLEHILQHFPHPLQDRRTTLAKLYWEFPDKTEHQLWKQVSKVDYYAAPSV
jgi:hypothetical protein